MVTSGSWSTPRKGSVLPVELEKKLRGFQTVIGVSQGTVDNKDAQKLFVPALEALEVGSHLVVATPRNEDLLTERPTLAIPRLCHNA